MSEHPDSTQLFHQSRLHSHTYIIQLPREHRKPLAIPLRLLIQLLKLLDQLLSQKLAQLEHTFIGNHSVRPTLLIATRAINKIAIAVDLQTAEDILWPSDAAEIRRVALVGDVYPAASARTTDAALR